MKGKIIWWILFYPLMCLSQVRYDVFVNKNLIDKSKEIAINQIGIIEKGKNRGEQIDKYNEIIGNPLGSPYCQAGQYYCYYMAYLELGLNPLNHPVPRNGLANSTFDYAKRIGKRNKKYFAKNNDFIVWKAIDSPFGHIERIYKTHKAGWVETIGFNVRVGGKEGVFIVKRNIYFPLSRIKQIRGIVGVVNE